MKNAQYYSLFRKFKRNPMRYSSTFARIPFINTIKNNKYWLSVDKKKLLDTVSGM